MSRFSWILRLPKNLMKVSTGTSGQQKEYPYKLKKFAFNLSGFNRYGLYFHDVLDYEMPLVREALRRLPTDVLDARNFRLIRACQLNLLKMHLPEEKWITFEQDREYRYLDLYLKEALAEQMEIHEFGCVNYSDHDWPNGVVK